MTEQIPVHWYVRGLTKLHVGAAWEVWEFVRINELAYMQKMLGNFLSEDQADQLIESIETFNHQKPKSENETLPRHRSARLLRPRKLD